MKLVGFGSFKKVVRGVLTFPEVPITLKAD